MKSVKCLFDIYDVTKGKTYKVVRESLNGTVVVIDDIGEEFALLSYQYETKEKK